MAYAATVQRLVLGALELLLLQPTLLFKLHPLRLAVIQRKSLASMAIRFALKVMRVVQLLDSGFAGKVMARSHVLEALLALEPRSLGKVGHLLPSKLVAVPLLRNFWDKSNFQSRATVVNLSEALVP
jgi:hypothetical protein